LVEALNITDLEDFLEQELMNLMRLFNYIGNGETEPNVKATEQELFEGLEAKSVNCWPSVNFDIGAINNFLKIFLPAGFYYKTFMWP
jgi:NADPH-dependent 2,4-dienoyl-CoA reductase/sulfur reductase-like enzyme